MRCNASMPWYLDLMQSLYCSSHSSDGRSCLNVGMVSGLSRKYECRRQSKCSLFFAQSILGLYAFMLQSTPHFS